MRAHFIPVAATLLAGAFALGACGQKTDEAAAPDAASSAAPADPGADLRVTEVGTAAPPASVPSQAPAPGTDTTGESGAGVAGAPGAPGGAPVEMRLPTSALPPLTVADETKAALFKSIPLTAGPNPGEAMNDCGEAVTPDYYAVELGGIVGRAYLVVMKGGPNSATCYGMTGQLFYLMRGAGESFSSILVDQGHLGVMTSEHNGVKDVAVGGPGFEFPVYEWNGTAYVQARTIPDTEFPAPINGF